MSTFVGRERELAELTGGLEDALSGRGRLFLISGEPGIGKSRLADELIDRAKELGAEVLVGRCWEAGGAPAFWPWVQTLRALVRGRDAGSVRADLGRGAPDIAHILPELRELFPDLSRPPSLESEAARFRLFDAVASFLRAAAEGRPLVLVLDDLHAADQPSLLLLQFVARELGASYLLLVGLFRDVDPTVSDPLAATLAELAREPVMRRVALRGLTEPDVARFIEETSDHAPRALVEAVFNETEGNPLFVEEIVRLLETEGRLDESTLQLTIPRTVAEVIGRRLRRLSGECNRALTVASVIGREFDLDVLGRVGGLTQDAVVRLLEEAVAERVVTDLPGTVSRLRFSHVLIRDSLYEGLAPAHRSELHGRALDVMEALYGADSGPHLTELTHHAIAAKNFGKALRYARQAGDRALGLLAYEEAVRLYETALTLVKDDAERCELLLAVGDAQSRAGDEPVAKQTFLDAAALARSLANPEYLGRAALGYGGRLLWARAGTDPHTIPLLREALAALQDDESALLVRVMARLANALRDERDREPGAALARAAVEIARRLGDSATLAYALEGSITATLWPENPEERIATAAEVARLAELAGDAERAAHSRYVRLHASLERGDMVSVRSSLAEYAKLAEDIRQPAWTWLGVATDAMLALFEGRFEEAEALSRQAVVQGEHAQAREARFAHWLQLFVLRRELGDLSAVEETVRRAVREYPGRPLMQCVLALLCAELGNGQEARGILAHLGADDFLAIPRTTEWLLSLGFLAETAERLGDDTYARTLFELVLPHAGRNAATADAVATGSVSRSLALLAVVLRRWRNAQEHFEEALRMNERMGARPWLARTQYDYARMLLARGGEDDTEKAAKLLESALATSRELGMGPLAAQVTALQASLLLDEVAADSAFAGYRIEEEVGRGGMGVVYRATDLRLERPVALKLIAPELASEEGFGKRFLRESKLAASLDHGNVVPIYEAGEQDGRLFLAMRYVPGSDLKALLHERGALPAEQTLSILGRVADALDVAHSKALVHRDVKPGNVLLDERGHPYLTDFGLTKEAGGTSTETGHLVGTLDYLAPEQIRGEEIDGRTDQYALGCLLYECLSGKPPFRRPTEAEVLWAHMQEPPPTLRDHPALDPVLARALAKNKIDRYPSCGEFLAAAHDALGLEAPALRRRRIRVGRRLLLAGAALVAAAGIAAAVVELTGGSSAKAGQIAPDSLGVVDPGSSKVVGQVPIPGRPSLVAVEGRTVWVASAAARTLSAISLGTLGVKRVVAPNVTPSDLAADGRGSLWLVDEGRRVIVKIDTAYGTVTRRTKLPPPTGEGDIRGRVRLDALGDAVWTTDGTRLLRLDPGTGAVRQSIDLGTRLTDVAVGPGAVWAVSGQTATVFRVDSRGEVTDRIRIVTRTGLTAPFPVAVAAGTTGVWVVNGNPASVTRIDPDLGAVVATIPLGVGANPSGIAVDRDSVWVANSGDGTLAHIDAATNTLTSTPIGASPAGLAVGGGRVWVTVQPSFRLKSGFRGTGANLGPALPTSFCSPIFYGGRGEPDFLIASDLPFQSIDAIRQTLQMSDAVRFVLAEHGFRAGRYSIGYQSCDDSSLQTGTWTESTCRRNAEAYAHEPNLLGVVGTYNSDCSIVELPILNSAPGGPLATVSPANTYVGLTRAGPGTAPDEPRRYYPRGVRNFVRVVAADDIQGAANALLAKRLGVSKLYILDDGEAYGIGIAESMRLASVKLGIEVVGTARWDARAPSYSLLAKKIALTGADAVYLGGIVDLNGVQLVRGLRAVLGQRLRIIAPDGFVPLSILIQGAGPATEGVMVSFPGVAPSGLAEAGRRFVSEFQKAVAGDVSPFSIATAQAADVLLDAIARSDGTRSSVVRELFRTRVEDGILGTFSFDRNGDTTAGAVTILTVKQGKERVFSVITPPRSLVRR